MVTIPKCIFEEITAPIIVKISLYITTCVRRSDTFNGVRHSLYRKTLKFFNVPIYFQNFLFETKTYIFIYYYKAE